MRKFYFVLFCFATLLLSAQDGPATIKVKREQNLVKAVFDNTEYRLFAVDRFGNPRENEIISYTLWIKDKGKATEMKGFSNNLTPEMIKELKKQKKATKIFFCDIKVKGDDDHVVDLPCVIDTWFPDCVNCLKEKK